MSRFIEVLNAHEGAISVEELPDILEAIRTRLNAETAHFKMTFPYFIDKKAPVTGARGMMPYVCGFDACAGTHNDFVVQVEVPMTTLCPCSKEISARGAHNQRGIVKLKVRFEGMLWIEELIDWSRSRRAASSTRCSSARTRSSSPRRPTTIRSSSRTSRAR